MSRALLSGVVGLVGMTALGLIWLVLKANRAPAEDRVTGNVLARINTEYRDPS